MLESRNMKKLLAIVVLGLLWSGSANAEQECVVGNCENGVGTLNVTNSDGNKAVISGNWVKGMLTGEGKIVNDFQILEGTFKNYELHGKGSQRSKDGTYSYEGDFIKGKAHGYGKTFKKNDNGWETYEGQFRKGAEHGKGILTTSEGVVYSIKAKKGKIVDVYQSPENKAKVEDKKSKNENKIKISEMIDDSKKTCKLLGMKEGTEKFSDCALKLYTQKVELAGQKNQQVIVQGQSTGSNVTTIYDPVRDSRALMQQGQRMMSGACTLGINC